MRVIPQHVGAPSSPQVQFSLLQRAYMFRPIIFHTIYIIKKIELKIINPHNNTKKAVLKRQTSFMPLNVLPRKLILPEKARTIAAKMLRTAINSVCIEDTVF